MKATRAERRLGSFERAQALTGEHFPYNLIVVVRLEGALPADRLRAALDEVQRRTPLLRARLDGTGRKAVFRLTETPPIPLRRESAEPGDWLRWVERELADGFERGHAPMARCLQLTLPWAEGKEACDLVLGFPHTIADGVCVARLVRDLLSLCTGGPPPETRDGLPPSADERFPRRCRAPGGGVTGLRFLLRQGADEVAFRRGRRRSPARPAPASSRCRVLTTGLSVEETTALLAASRARRVALNGALEAAMLLAVSRRRYGGARLPLRYFVFPVLRPHLEPPIESGVFACYTIALRFTHELGGDDELWSVAAAIGRRIDAAMSGDEKFLASIWSPLSMRMILGQSRQRMGTTALSYVGPLTIEAVGSAADRLTVRDVHTFVSNFPLGPEYTAQARIHRGRLIWDIVYLDGEMTREEAWAIAEEMKALLSAAEAVTAGR